jgi:hypothetical protein
MSKERELIKAMKILLECTYMDSRQRQADALIGRAIELLAQPEPIQEPVGWQYRTKPNWKENWSKWEDCRKESYEDYIRVPLLHDWLYETREIYTSPPTCEPVRKVVIGDSFMINDTKYVKARDPLSDDVIWDGRCSQGVPDYKSMTFIKGIRFAENQHGIGVDDE